MCIRDSKRTPQPPLSSDVRVSFEHDHRYKGLRWFSTYTVRFEGAYTARGSEQGVPAAGVLFQLPENARAFEKLTVTLDGEAQEPAFAERKRNALLVPLPSDGAEHSLTIAYTTRGRDRWEYSSDSGGGAGVLRNFTLTARCDFADIDYPKGSVSPTTPAEQIDGGTRATWHYDDMRATQTMGIEMPARTDAGPIAARMSFFAPVSLFFFFTVLFTVVVLRKIPLHPMHYLFVAAGFFAFHILLAYLVDKMDLQASFWICAAVSVLMVVSYMRLVAGVKFAVLYVGLAQLVYLVGFSYAFFWVGWTGLTGVIGAIATLFVLMQATGRVNWFEVFHRPGPPELPRRLEPVGPPPAAPPPAPGEGNGPAASPQQE